MPMRNGKNVHFSFRAFSMAYSTRGQFSIRPFVRLRLTRLSGWILFPIRLVRDDSVLADPPRRDSPTIHPVMLLNAVMYFVDLEVNRRYEGRG
jgi:hypothetical protein